MRCPYCQNQNTYVVDSRDADENRIRRRRQCSKCKKRFTTYEEIEKEDLFVIKKDGRRERFDRKKLLGGLEKSCEKRQISREKIEEIAKWVEAKIRRTGKKEIPTSVIGELVMEKLRKVDEVAYIRFASVYRSFTDIESFEDALRKLKRKNR